jgi:undecaprenyl pyrophosphate phosphatase UppP
MRSSSLSSGYLHMVDANAAEEGQLRDAYLPNRRVRFASDVAGLCAVLLLLGLLGAAFSWWGRSDLFDLASNELEAVKMDIGFLAGPVLVLVTLPLVIGRARQVALTRWFRARLLAAAVLWVAGLVILVAKVSGLDSSYTLEAGTYVSAGLMAVGLLATLAMWPGGLPVVQDDRNGFVRESGLLQHRKSIS